MISYFLPLQAYKLGLYGAKIVWIFYGWFSLEFWKQGLDDLGCSEDEMRQAAEGAFMISHFKRNQLVERGIAGLTGILKPSSNRSPDILR